MSRETKLVGKTISINLFETDVSTSIPEPFYLLSEQFDEHEQTEQLDKLESLNQSDESGWQTVNRSNKKYGQRSRKQSEDQTEIRSYNKYGNQSKQKSRQHIHITSVTTAIPRPFHLIEPNHESDVSTWQDIRTYHVEIHRKTCDMECSDFCLVRFIPKIVRSQGIHILFLQDASEYTSIEGKYLAQSMMSAKTLEQYHTCMIMGVDMVNHRSRKTPYHNSHIVGLCFVVMALYVQPGQVILDLACIVFKHELAYRRYIRQCPNAYGRGDSGHMKMEKYVEQIIYLLENKTVLPSIIHYLLSEEIKIIMPGSCIKFS